jgi:WD40 repeat protein
MTTRSRHGALARGSASAQAPSVTRQERPREEVLHRSPLSPTHSAQELSPSTPPTAILPLVTLTIRAGADKLDSIIATKNDSKEWIEAMRYSPDGSKLAVGSHDNNIYVYSTDNYRLLGKCTKHNSFIVCLDWSLDGQFIRSCCGAHELLFFNGETYQ